MPVARKPPQARSSISNPRTQSDAPRLRRLISPVDQHPTYARFTFEGPPAQLASALLGGPVRYHHSKLNFKWSGGGEEVKWHQDIQFWPHTDFTPLTIGVYLEDVDPEMSPMGVLPGSHRGPLFDQYAPDGSWAGSMADADVATLDLDQMVYLGGPAGSVTVHNCCMIHGSLPNNFAAAPAVAAADLLGGRLLPDQPYRRERRAGVKRRPHLRRRGVPDAHDRRSPDARCPRLVPQGSADHLRFSAERR